MKAKIGKMILAGVIIVVIGGAIQLIRGRSDVTTLAAGQQVTQVPYDYGLDGSDHGLERALENNKKRYMLPRSEPAVSMEQALAEVQRVFEGQVAQATNIKARYVRFSDDMQCREFAPDDCRLLYQDMPAWVFTLDGLNIPSRGPAGSPKVYSHEIHVVVNAETGEYVMSYIFR